MTGRSAVARRALVVGASGISGGNLTERLLERGVAVSDLRAGWLRAVTHLDIGDDEIEQAIERMQEVLSVHA